MPPKGRGSRMFGVGPAELVIVLVVALLVFGPKRLPEIGRSLGAAMRQLRQASNDFTSLINSTEFDEPDEPSTVEESKRRNTNTKAGE